MTPEAARRLLGVEPGAEWAEVRAAHRRLIRRAHPDAGGTPGRASLVNRALDVLREADGETGRPPEPQVEARQTSRRSPPDVDRFFVVEDRPQGLLARLAEAGHEVGEVVFVDPHVGLLEIVVGNPPNVGQLAVTVGTPAAGGTPVAFTLDPLGAHPAPPIDAVVDALMTALRQT